MRFYLFLVLLIFIFSGCVNTPTKKNYHHKHSKQKSSQTISKSQSIEEVDAQPAVDNLYDVSDRLDKIISDMESNPPKKISTPSPSPTVHKK